MTLGNASHQKPGKPGRDTFGLGEARANVVRDEARPPCHQQEGLGREGLLTQVLSRENMAAAWKRVKANKGSAGVDGLWGLNRVLTIKYFDDLGIPRLT